MNRIDIGNVRGIRGEKGERGEKGSSPSYEDLKYVKRNDEFVVLTTNCNISQSQYYLDRNKNLCDSEGHLYDENNYLTNEIGEPFDVSEYGYYYEQLYLDCNDKFTNSKGELLDDNFEVQYIQSNFIRDISTYIYKDEEGCNLLVETIAPYLANILLNADPDDEEYRAFFDELEGDIKYYICEDNPKTNIYLDNNDELVNTCKYKDENGDIVRDENNNYVYVPLERNALYLYNSSGLTDNDIMHYDIYVCLGYNTVPKKLVSANDFIVNYNVIDDVSVDVEENSTTNENDVYLNIVTRGTSGQFYNIHDVDTLFANNVINKLGANNGIAQLNSSGKVPSTQLPAYIDDVVEGTMNSAGTTFTPSNETYIDSVRQKGKIYVDTNTRKTYRWTGSAYIFISNPVVVDDGTTEAYASASGSALETLLGNSSLNTTNQTITGAINEINSNKVSSWASPTTDVHYPSEKLVKDNLDLKINKSDIQNSLNSTSTSKVLSAKQGKVLNDTKVDKVEGMGLSTNNFDNTYKGKIDGLDDYLSEILTELAFTFIDINITANKTIIELNETTTITISVTENSVPVPNTSVDLYQDDVKIQTLTTDNNGEISYTYTGANKGHTIFQAKKSIINSNELLIEDCYYINLTERTVTGSSTIVESALKTGLENIIDDNFVLEFDLQNVNTTSVGYGLNIGAKSQYTPPSTANYRIFIGVDSKKASLNNRTSNSDNTYGNSVDTEYHSFKLEKQNNDFIGYMDDVQFSSKTISWLNDYNEFDLYGISWSNANIKIKNIKLRKN